MVIRITQAQKKPQFSTQDWKHTQSDTTIQQWHTKAHTNTNITALNFTMSESLWCQIYIFLFCLTNIQVICANFSIQLFGLRATFNFAIISRRRSPASSRLRLGKGYRKYSSPCRRTLRPGGPAASQSCRTTIDLCVAGAHDGAGTTSRLLCCLPPLLVGTCLSILGPPPLDCPWAVAGLFRGRPWAAMGRIWLPDQRWHQYTDQRIRGGISIDTSRHAKYAINIQTTRLEMASLLLIMHFQTVCQSFYAPKWKVQGCPLAASSPFWPPAFAKQYTAGGVTTMMKEKVMLALVVLKWR